MNDAKKLLAQRPVFPVKTGDKVIIDFNEYPLLYEGIEKTFLDYIRSFPNGIDVLKVKEYEGIPHVLLGYLQFTHLCYDCRIFKKL